MSNFQPGDIVERIVGDGLSKNDPIKQYGRYVVEVARDASADITLKDCWGAWIASRFILVARGVGLELSQFVNKGSQ